MQPAAIRNVAVVIPAYRPEAALCDLVSALSAGAYRTILIIDDGSGPEFSRRFHEVSQIPGARVLQHAVNLGKGAALKTGMNQSLLDFPDIAGVVTVDADGQHDPADVGKVAGRLAANPECLVMGVRAFDRSVPLRSRLGNKLTRSMMRLLMGQNLSDTQTGLRGIPRALLPRLLQIASNAYEFELDMLTTAKHHSVRILEEPIRTIYEAGNATSHFNPLRDSMKIYFVLLRFGLVSMLTALLDNAVFILAFRSWGQVAASQAAARAVALLFNYTAGRSAVFLSREGHQSTLPKYLFLVVASGTVSYGLLTFLHNRFGLEVIWAKLLAEGILFTANFAVQRDFVFTKRSPAGSTDWDRYYRSTPVTARLTRRYTGSVIVSVLRRFLGGRQLRSVVEIGGANSCLLDRVYDEVRPEVYHVVDTNEIGLRLLQQRIGARRNVVLHNVDCRNLSLGVQADLVLSVGLIEHFDQQDTRRATLAHFDVLRPGGWAIISFPAPTWLYRAARFVSEAFGLWRFPDERPLARREVFEAVQGRGRVVFEKTLWPLVFTQHVMVFEKAGPAPRI
ncbi:MAG: GtrA family protein [Bryobacteraceae bacterium]